MDTGTEIVARGEKAANETSLITAGEEMSELGNFDKLHLNILSAKLGR